LRPEYSTAEDPISEVKLRACAYAPYQPPQVRIFSLFLLIAPIDGTILPGVRALGKLKKLLQKIKNNPREVRFDELDKILTRSGFTRRQPGSGSSHYIYTKGAARLVLPYHQPHIKTVYVERAIKILEGEMDDD